MGKTKTTYTVSMTFHDIVADSPEEAVEKYVDAFHRNHWDLSYDVEDDVTDEQFEIARKNPSWT